MVERRFEGRPAAPGLAIGPLIHIERTHQSKQRQVGSPKEERSALEAAISQATSDLEALAASDGPAIGDGPAILAFQIEMLNDPALIGAVWPMIKESKDAVQAWTLGLDAEIEGYRGADDDYFQARASDLEDLKDRIIRVLEGKPSTLPDLPKGAILLARDLPPSLFLALDQAKIGGVALTEGSANSHVALLLRARGLPMIVGLDRDLDHLIRGDDTIGGNTPITCILDGDEGCLLTTPKENTGKRYQTRQSERRRDAERDASQRDQPAITADGQAVSVLVNIDDPAAIDDAILAAADGVGLLRTEFLLIGHRDLPSEEEHFQTYAALQERLAGRQLIIRTLDIGGDKPVPHLDLPKEQNPFLGLRGLRLCLDHPDIFRPQVRALLRTAAKGPLDVMLPMVAAPSEIEETRHVFAAHLQDLKKEGIAAVMPRLGIMVETPAAALAADRLDAAFFSIGSNDLIQYTMAAARDGGGRVAALLDPGHIAIERLIKMVVDHGQAANKDVSLCGDMASEPAWLPLLLRAGLRKISVASATFDRIKAAIKTIDLRPEAEISVPTKR